MKNTARKGFLFLVLALIVAGGVFAQRVGDTVQIDGQPYTIRSVSGDTVTLQRAPDGIDGVWVGYSAATHAGNAVITISGNGAVINEIGTSRGWVDARNKGYINAGSQLIRNIQSTSVGPGRQGTQEWSCQVLLVLMSSNVASGAEWVNGRLNLYPDGRLTVTAGPYNTFATRFTRR